MVINIQCEPNAQSSRVKCAKYAHDRKVRAVHISCMDTAWFKARKKQMKVSDEKLAAAIGRDRTTVTKVINGDVRFDLAFVEGFASVLDVSPEEVLEHVGVTLDPGRIAASANLSVRDAASHRQVSDQPVARSVGGGEVVLIHRLDLSLPMGPGATVDDYVEEEPIAFDLGYLRAFTRTAPHHLRLATGAGDSMFPTLVPNDLVWIDTTQNELIHSDRIYAASINGGAAIKRLRPIASGQRVLVISDNKTVDSYEVDANDIQIWGRVIRFARDL